MDTTTNQYDPFLTSNVATFLWNRLSASIPSGSLTDLAIVVSDKFKLPLLPSAELVSQLIHMGILRNSNRKTWTNFVIIENNDVYDN